MLLQPLCMAQIEDVAELTDAQRRQLKYSIRSLLLNTLACAKYHSISPQVFNITTSSGGIVKSKAVKVGQH